MTRGNSYQNDRHIKSLVLNAKTYTAYLPVATPNYDLPVPSILRHIPNEGAIYNVSSNDLTCNKGAYPINDNGVARVAPVTAGTNITYYWNEWSHLSPILTYMAKCANNNCGNFTGSEGAVWFKIAENAHENGSWATQKLTDAKFKWDVTIPKCLAPGQYLVRHEIIQLAGAQYLGTCQFYMNCAQVNVIGSGTVSPSDLVAIPGTYSATDPGILYNTYKSDPKVYPIPGPRPFKCPV